MRRPHRRPPSASWRENGVGAPVSLCVLLLLSCWITRMPGDKGREWEAVAGLTMMASGVRRRRGYASSSLPEPRAGTETAIAVGDWIVVHDGKLEGRLFGRVVARGRRATRLLTPENVVVALPNRILERSVVTTIGQGEACRLSLSLTLDASVPLSRALRILEAGALAAVGEQGPLSRPAPEVLVKGPTERGILYEVKYWTNPVVVKGSVARSTVLKHVLQHLRQAGLLRENGPGGAGEQEKAGVEEHGLENLEGRIRALRSVTLFKDLEADRLEELARSVRERTYRSGEVLLEEGERGDSMFILLEGLLKVLKRTSLPGELLQVGRLTPGDFLGEMSLLTGQPRSAVVVAETEVVALEVARENLGELLMKRPEYALRLSVVAAERRLKNQRRIGQHLPPVSKEDVTGMVSTILTEMQQFYGARA